MEETNVPLPMEAEPCSSPVPMLPTFIVKLWNIVNNPDIQDIISWNEVGNAFEIKDQIIFYTTVLPAYYKHKNMTSFTRQLNLYGFHKVSSLKSNVIEFYHPYFQRDEPELLTHIKRKTSVSHSRNTNISTNKDIHKVITEVKQIKDKQDSVDDQLEQLRDENSALWYELNDLREKHVKQSKIINKLMQFLIKFVQPNVKNLHTSGPRPSSSGGATIFEVDGDDDAASEYWKQYDERMIEGKPDSPCPKMIENRSRKSSEVTKDTDNSMAVASYNNPTRVLNEIYNMLKSNRNVYQLEDVEPKKPKIEPAVSSDYELCDDRLLEELESKLSEGSSNEDDTSYVCLPVEAKNEQCAIDYKISKSKITPELKSASVKPLDDSHEVVNYELIPCGSPGASNKMATHYILQRKPTSKMLSKNQVDTDNAQVVTQQKAKNIIPHNQGTNKSELMSNIEVDTSSDKQINYTEDDARDHGINSQQLVNQPTNGKGQQISKKFKQIIVTNPSKQATNANKQMNIGKSDLTNVNIKEVVTDGKKQISNISSDIGLTDDVSNKEIIAKNPTNQVTVTNKQMSDDKSNTTVLTGSKDSSQMIANLLKLKKQPPLKYAVSPTGVNIKNIKALPKQSQVTYVLHPTAVNTKNVNKLPKPPPLKYMTLSSTDVNSKNVDASKQPPIMVGSKNVTILPNPPPLKYVTPQTAAANKIVKILPKNVAPAINSTNVSAVPKQTLVKYVTPTTTVDNKIVSPSPKQPSTAIDSKDLKVQPKQPHVKYVTPTTALDIKSTNALSTTSDITLSDIDELLKEASAEPEQEQQSDTAKDKEKMTLSGEALDQHVQDMDVDLANLRDILSNCEIDPDVLLDMFSSDLSEPVDTQIDRTKSGESSVGKGDGNQMGGDGSQVMGLTNLGDSGNYNLDCLDMNLPFDDYEYGLKPNEP